MKTLIYNVYNEDINRKEILKYNIFNHGGFYKDLLKAKKKFKKEYKKFMIENSPENKIVDPRKYIKWETNYKETTFSEDVINSLRYYFWGKCEWEVVITSWPPYITKTEFEKLKNEDTSTHYAYTIDPEVADKVDVFDQVMLNKDIFIDYIWANLDSIKERK